jgi:hypothetical protein
MPAYLSNDVLTNDMYPSAIGMGSTGLMATNPTSRFSSPTSASTTSQNASPVENALAVGAGGHAGVWWIALVGLLVGLMYFAQHYDGGEGNYSNLRLSAYNILTITLAAIIGINLFKITFTKFPVPGLSTVVMAA